MTQMPLRLRVCTCMHLQMWERTFACINLQMVVLTFFSNETPLFPSPHFSIPLIHSLLFTAVLLRSGTRLALINVPGIHLALHLSLFLSPASYSLIPHSTHGILVHTLAASTAISTCVITPTHTHGHAHTGRRTHH